MLLYILRVKGHSMEPAYNENDLVFAFSYLLGSPKEKDVVIVKDKKKYLIKRVIKIKNNKYFLLGDNLKDSLDSRKMGWIDRQSILGYVLYKI